MEEYTFKNITNNKTGTNHEDEESTDLNIDDFLFITFYNPIFDFISIVNMLNT